MKKLVLVALISALCADLSYGAGFALYEYSGRATAMGGAVMANGAEPASLATNPALITELEGTQAQLGVTVVSANAKTSIKNPLTGKFESRELKRDIWTLPNFYITHKWSDDISFGLGGFSRYGLGGTYKHHVEFNINSRTVIVDETNTQIEKNPNATIQFFGSYKATLSDYSSNVYYKQNKQPLLGIHKQLYKYSIVSGITLGFDGEYEMDLALTKQIVNIYRYNRIIFIKLNQVIFIKVKI